MNTNTEELRAIGLLADLIDRLAGFGDQRAACHAALASALSIANLSCGTLRILATNETSELAADIGFESPPDTLEHEVDLARNLGFDSALCVPLFDLSGIRTGAMTLYHDAGRAPDERARRWIELCAKQVSFVRTWRRDQHADANEARFRSIFQESNDFIVTADLRQTITYCNPATAAALGWPADEIVGRSISEFIPTPHFDRTSAMLNQKLREGGSTRYEVDVIARGGRHMTWEINSRLTFGSDGNPTGLHAIGRDVTTMRAAHEALRDSERALREADQRKNEYLAMLAHELRNPLAPIRTAAQVLKHARANPMQVEQASTVVERQVEHITRIVDDLLDVSRVMRGLVTLELRPTVLQDIVNTAIEQVRPLIERNQHRLNVSLPERPIVLSSEGVRLVQIVSNLLSNAARHSGTSGTIDLSIVAHLQLVEIHVRDYGAGIPAELLPRVFDLFAQGDQTTARTEGGLGIGLALVRRLAELHGGHVEAKSAGPGHGAEFVVVLPRWADAAIDAPLEAREPTCAGQSRRVLIVDDNRDAADMLAMLLQTDGHAPFVEYAATPALARAQIERPEVLLLDIGLPDMNGYELAVRLRALPEVADATFVAITGYGQDEDRRRSIQAGFHHHLMKPVSAEDLRRVFAQVPAQT